MSCTLLQTHSSALVRPAASTRHTPFASRAYSLCVQRVACSTRLGSRVGLGKELERSPVAAQVFPFDMAWAPDVNASSLAPQLFAMSLFPYLCFLFYLTKSGKTPKLTLFGFYFLLVFVGATIPAGLYAKSEYGTSLANVDWLHGTAESLLTVTNLFVVLGLRHGIRVAEAAKKAAAEAANGEAAATKAPVTEEVTR